METDGKSANFWKGKTPCWDLLNCSSYVHADCPAYRHQERPCWEHGATHCRKLLEFEWECRDCKVFMLYHACSDSA